ncbi:uncharacterized protein LOC128963268 [Oppia nitens]|uniref:uncharacterized protein LOC128963268 n=1 Tax=Oppia nitens TaxID=1686743 RepID=UPI0023DC5890|nr:uncharacterized protein LOC128963268 [Oppia nitens]
MNIKFVLSLVVLVALLVGQSEAQNKNQRRNRNRNKKTDQCHLKEMETCLNKMQSLGKGKDPTSLIATAEGLDKICNTIREDTIKCIKAYGKKCGTPLHREVMDLVVDQITGRLNVFCKADNPDRKDFLKESPCIHQKVLSTEEYKKGCNNNFLATVDQVDDEITGQADDSHSRMCCGYSVWYDCTTKMIKDKCGDLAIKNYGKFMGGVFGTLTNMACPVDLFPAESDQCQKLKPVPGTKAKGKIGDNALTKYVTSLFSFMFITDETEEIKEVTTR